MGGVGERGGMIRGGFEGIDGVTDGLGVGSTNRGRAGWSKSLYKTGSGVSFSTEGYGGVVGGGDGEGESEETMTASGGFGRRRFEVGWVGRANVGLLSSNPSTFPLSSVFSMSSRAFPSVASGRRGRLEKGEACCVAFSRSNFWVERKLNFGAGLNC